MYPPPPPPSNNERSGFSSSSQHLDRGPTSADSSEPGPSSSRLTSNALLGNRSHHVAPSPLSTHVFSLDHATGESNVLSDTAAHTYVSSTHVDDIEWVFTPPVLVKHGMFEGRSLRFALAVAQEPVLGRRKTEKDRRPLGPAPIVRFRAIERKRRKSGSGSSGTGSEEEIDPSSFETSHLICAAELAPPTAPPPGIPAKSKEDEENGEVTSAKTGNGRRSIDEDVSMVEDAGETLEIMRSSPPNEHGFDGRLDPSSSRIPTVLYQERESSLRSGSGFTTPRLEEEMAVDTPSPEDELEEEEIISSTMQQVGFSPNTPAEPINNRKSKEQMGGSKGVRNLYGNLHVAGVRVPAPEGGMGTWFLFTDLSVRHEGTYSLRFRCFDLTAISSDAGTPAPCLVEAQSQPFRVYSPRQVPPLPKPTELAEHFAKQGFKLNTRKNERTASSPPPPNSSSSIPPPPLFNERSKKSSKNANSTTGRERPGVKPIQSNNDDSEFSGRGEGGNGSSTNSSRTTIHDFSTSNESVSLGNSEIRAMSEKKNLSGGSGGSFESIGK